MMDYSFIIPVYNCKAYLNGCVESIRAVGLKSCEILLVDDGSTDGSGELCDGLAEKYPEVRAIHQENGGVSAARNRGLREATGDYLLFLDADDSIDPVLLGKILADPRVRQTDLTVYGLTFDYYRKGICYRRDPLFYEFDGILEREAWADLFRVLFEKNSLSPVWNKVYRRSVLLENDLVLNAEMFLYEDLEFVLRYLQHCETIWNVPVAVYHYRQSEDEGNAGRRLARIERISGLLEPIEAAMDNLSGVPQAQKDEVLLLLFQVLAREKISGADLAGIRRICADYSRWYQARGLTLGEGKFHQDLLTGKAGALMFQSKKTALRHAAAVRVKAMYQKYTRRKMYVH